MNKVFKTVWNASLGVWVAVSETAAGQKKGSNKLKKAAANAVATVVVGAAAVASTGTMAWVNQTPNAPVSKLGVTLGVGTIAIGSEGSGPSRESQVDQDGNLVLSENGEEIKIVKSNQAKATGNLTVAVGAQAEAEGQGSTAIGALALAKGQNSTAIGQFSTALDGATALGGSSNASGLQSTAIGTKAEALDQKTIALGDSVVAKGTNAIAIGASATGSNSISLGGVASKEGAISIGQGAVSGLNSAAVGHNNSVAGSNTFVLGTGIDLKSTVTNSVVLGANSELTQVHNALDVMPASYEYKDAQGNIQQNYQVFDFAGLYKSQDFATEVDAEGNLVIKRDENGLPIYANGPYKAPPGAVSVGKSGAERQIQHVGAGRITSESTDAVNGSQLYYVLSEAKQAQADAAKPINFVTVDQDGKPVIGDVYVFDADGKVQLDAAGNPVTQKGPLSAQVQLGDTFNIQGAKVTIGEDGNPVLTVDAAAASAWKLATDGNVTNASTIGGETNTVNFVGSKNAEVSQTVLTDATGKPIGTQVNVEVADQIQLTENGGLTIAGVPELDPDTNLPLTDPNTGLPIYQAGKGPITINQGNVNFGGNVISGVAPGVAGTDAVNVDQLKGSGWGLGNATVLDVDGKVVTDANGQPVTTAKINPDDQVEHKAGPSNNVTVNTTVQKVEMTDENGQVVLDAKGQPVLVDKATVTVDLADQINLSKDGGLTIAGVPELDPATGAPLTDPTTGLPVYKEGNSPITIQQGNVSFGGNQLKDVAAGTDLTDAVNVSQLQSAGWTLGNAAVLDKDGNPVKDANGKPVTTAKINPNDQVEHKAGSDNVTVGTTVQQVALKDANGNDVKDAHGNTVMVDKATVTVDLADQINLSKDGGLTVAGGGTYNLLDAQGNPLPTTYVAGDINLKQGEVSFGGNQIHNVAAGTAPTDAVNVSQLQSAGWNIIAQDKESGAVTENAVNGDKAANNSSVQFNGDDNISVSQTSKEVKDKDGNVVGTETVIAVELDKDVNLSADGSLTIGDTSVNNDGLTIAGIPKLDPNTGLALTDPITGLPIYEQGRAPIVINQGNVNFGGNVIGGVAKGVADDDAVNVSQLKDEIGKAVSDSGWTLTTGGVAADQGEKIKPNTTVDFSGDDVGNIQVSNEGSNVKVELNPNLDLGKDGSVSIGDTLLNGEGLTVGDITIQEGENGVNFAGNQINNVGTATENHQAVNLGQLKDEIGGLEETINNNIANSGWNLTGKDAAGNTVSEKVNPNDTVEFVAGPSANTTVTTETTPNGAKVTVDINDQLNLTGDAGSLTIGAGKGNDAITIQQGNVSVGGNQIHNLAAGTAGTDAVNVDQLKGTINIFGGGAAVNPDGSIQAPTYNVNGGSYNNVGEALGALNQADIDLGDRVTNLQQSFNNRIDDVEDRMSAGIAAAMALETAPYVPGKYTYAAATAYHNGQAALGVTLRKTADNGRWSLTGGVAAGTEGDPSVRLGVSGIID